MHIKVWGCRGSIPSPGCGTKGYGGNTTCLEVRLEDGTLVIIDAGTGIRELGNAILKRNGPQALYLLITHAHWDHLQGFPFFVPAYTEGYSILVRSGPRVRASLEHFLAHQMDPPFFPVTFGNLKARFDFQSEDESEIAIDGTLIRPVLLNHPDGGYGYQFLSGGRKFVFLTDTELAAEHPGGLSRAEYLEICRGADLLIHDAQYTEQEYRRTRGWGHSTYRDAAEFALEAGARRLGLFHHDPLHTDREIDGFVRECRRLVRRSHGSLECFAVREGMELVP
ncbi:MAG: MBL fold metallo-hydrolase [Spirochaetales bacterium]|nr:MBL fold metallo-hydrolase [Spirochaetales bacterium]